MAYHVHLKPMKMRYNKEKLLNLRFLQHKELTAEEILGGIDAMKVKSCMTLFAEVSPDDIFDEVLKVFYNGSYDKLTLDLM